MAPGSNGGSEDGFSSAPPPSPTSLRMEHLSLRHERFEERYRPGAALGRGGMGEVRLYQDERIGRDVALKQLRSDAAADHEEITRFVREARVQGQLEHPAIPPVYDLGLAPNGTPYFTMKRLRGRTLYRILRDLRRREPDAEREFSRRRLLTEFANACLAVEFAHIHGVFHRDLKPANIMLGDFGEIYVLDWGVAKIAGAPDTLTSRRPKDAVVDTRAGSEAETSADIVLGTPGYMAPEQLTGHDLDSRADVYALGCILFEILTYERLHPYEERERLIRSTLDGADARASRRARGADVPPELEAICVRATASARDDRYPTVRRLHDDLQRYLDGDRDLARRRELASQHARRAAEAALGAARGGEERARAMQEASRALVLDPENEQASRVVVQLALQPPRDVPDEVRRAIRGSTLNASRENALIGGWCYLLVLGYVPLLLWMGLREVWLALLLGGSLAVLSGVAFAYARSSEPPKLFLVGSLVLNAVLIGLFSRIFGPLILAPGVACATTVIYILHARFQRWAPLCLALGCLAILVPFLLQVTGLTAASYAFADGALVVRPLGVELSSPTAALVFMVAAALGVIATPTLAVARLRRSLFEAERRLHMQAWQLRQLVPEGARELTAE